MDIVPTLANLVQLDIPPRWGGTSLVPGILQRRANRPQELVHQYYLPERRRDGEDPLVAIGLRTPRYNLIHDRRSGSYQLYAWKTDVGERKNLATDPAMKAVFASLRGKLAAYLAATTGE